MPSMTAIRTESPETSTVFETILAVCQSRSWGAPLVPVATTLARLAGARLVVAHAARPTVQRSPSDALWLASRAQEPADVVAIATSGDSRSDDAAASVARRLLDAGTAVLAVPPLGRPQPHLRHIGVGYDGGEPAKAAQATARALVYARPGQIARVDLAHVDDSAAWEAPGEPYASQRAAAIEWWLEQVSQHLCAPVRTIRPIGDAATELAKISRHLDLLVIGTRGRAPLRRALTGSVSGTLIGTTRCPLLIVPPGFAPGPAAQAELRMRARCPELSPLARAIDDTSRLRTDFERAGRC